MATNTDFLRFSAYSIKDLITRKLAQDSKFTDQVYEGSNLAILIDIFSYMAQCMMYALNNTAAETMFADTQIYENMNRLVRFIGYNPKGCMPSNAIFTCHDFSLSNDVIIPKYACIDTKKTDSNGKPIYFSTIENETISNNTTQILFYNGKWKKYSTTFVSSGEEYQIFILDGLQSDTLNNKNVPWKMIHVYVENDNKIEQYTCVTEGLFTDNNIQNGTYIYSAEPIFNLQLNETKTYEIHFGNGITGKIPPANSAIHIFYLDSNGLDEKVELAPNEIDEKIKHDFAFFGVEKDIYNKIFTITDNFDTIKKDNKFKNITKSSIAIPEEDVNDIRNNAPHWFKSGNRLVTANDYTNYIKNRFADNIVDIKCQNNWSYVSTFYKWLYELGLNGKYCTADIIRQSSGQYYINQSKMVKYDYKYADAADSNNIYLWIKMKNDSDIYKNVIDNEIQNIKMLTQEIVYIKPLTVYFYPCASTEMHALQYFKDNNGFDPNNESYIELTIDDNDIFQADTSVKLKTANIIRDFFNEKNCVLGQFVDYSLLCQQIYANLPITKIKTVFKDSNKNINIIDGLSFASWTASYIDLGDDLNITASSKTLEIFQYPMLYNAANILNKIKVIRKVTNNINMIQY